VGTTETNAVQPTAGAGTTSAAPRMALAEQHDAQALHL
jgi:hypothetical protein